MMNFVIFIAVVMAVVIDGVEVPDEDYAKFPRLYHLDHYEDCLSRTDGLYCLGTFQISPLKEPNPTFAMIKEYSQDPCHFDRTKLHRGYCVSSRCPELMTEHNASLRFERCVEHWARRRSLRTSLSNLDYCRSYAQEYAQKHNPEPLDVPQKVFLLVLMMLAVMNTIGTVYDVVMGDNVKKNQLVTVWSIRSNWQRLTTTYEEKDPRSALTPVQGHRVFLTALIIFVHGYSVIVMLYLNNPSRIEQVYKTPWTMIFLNGIVLDQIFTILCSFLLAYNKLLSSKNNTLSFKMLPEIVIKRIVRLSPLHLIMVGYAATWWLHSSSGPMWPAIVGAESKICRAKFWTHVFYVHNFIEPETVCLLHNWYLAVDMQLYILAAVLTLSLAHLRRRALPYLAGLVIASSILNGVLAYVFNWQSPVYYNYPKYMYKIFREASSHSRFYQSPWANLPACLVGLFIAFLHFEIQEGRVQLTSYKWFKLSYRIAPLAIIGWIMSGIYVRQCTEPWFVATYAALERFVHSILAAVILIGMFNGLGGWLCRVLSWRGWQTVGRLSLAALTVHWCVNMNISASRDLPLTASVLNLVVDWLATMCLSYILAIPLNILVEAPVQRFIDLLIFPSKTKPKHVKE